MIPENCSLTEGANENIAFLLGILAPRHLDLINDSSPVVLSLKSAMILGLRTAIFPTPDLARGKAWYSQVLGIEPYFDQSFYVGFSVAGFELGLIPDGQPGVNGVQAYWGVSNADEELARLVGLGAVVHEPVKDVGEGIKAAAVLDPFGNLFSIIENPHFNVSEVR